MQGGNITEAYQPFGRGFQFCQCQLVNQLDAAVATTVADDGLDAGITQGPADVAHAFRHGTGILSVNNFAHIRANDRFQSPVS